MKFTSSRLSRLASLFLFSPLILLSVASCESVGESDDPSGSMGGERSSANGSTVTWHQDIAPLVSGKCSGCHREEGIAPFALENYEQAKRWAPHMAEAVSSGAMPPWGAQETEECSPPAPFKNDIRLSDEEKALFESWVEGGRLEGDPASASTLPSPPQLDLEKPQRGLTIPSSATIDGSSDDFICFTLDPKIDKDVWLTGTQIEAGNSRIVHHALVFLDAGGEAEKLADENGQYKCFGSPLLEDPVLLGVWAPGALPGVLPENMGTPLKPGDKLVVQIHYHPTGEGAEMDATTRVNLQWIEDEPDYISRIFLIGNIQEEDAEWAGGKGYGLTTGPDFLIPAGAKGHQEINRFLLDDGGDPFARLVPVHVWLASTHMHYVGTDMKITVTEPSGAEQCLVQTPKWDFEWQRGYFYEGEVEELPVVRLGDSLTMRCTYDNSMDNPFVREALEDQGLTEPQDVRLGDETLDEMCIGVFGFAVHKDVAKDFGFQR